MKKLYFFLCFIGSAQAMRQDRNPEDYLEQAQKQESRKKELLKQAFAISAYGDEFFECFAHPYKSNQMKLRTRYNVCTTLQERLEEAKLIKPWNDKEYTNAKYNPDVSERLYFECDLLSHYFYRHQFSSMDVQAASNRTKYGIKAERKRTLQAWPEELRKKYPVLAIATFLNEGKYDPSPDAKRDFVSPNDFIAMRKEYDQNE